MSPSQSATAGPSELPTSLPKLTSPLFVQPSKTPEPTPPSLTPESSHPGSPDQPPAEASWSTDAPDAGSGPAPGESSDTPSSGSGVKLSKSGLRAALGMGFRKACLVVASVISDQEQREAGLWVPDDEDVKDVSTPAANIVYRRLPDEAKGGDVIDLFALGLALVGYVGKNLAYRAELRTLRQLQEAQGITPEQE